jgi:hypothetical protein
MHRREQGDGGVDSLLIDPFFTRPTPWVVPWSCLMVSCCRPYSE